MTQAEIDQLNNEVSHSLAYFLTAPSVRRLDTWFGTIYRVGELIRIDIKKVTPE